MDKPRVARDASKLGREQWDDRRLRGVDAGEERRKTGACGSVCPARVTRIPKEHFPPAVIIYLFLRYRCYRFKHTLACVAGNMILGAANV